MECWSNGVMAWWVRIRVVAVAISCWLYAFILTAAPAFAVDKLRVSYASVTGNTAGITYIAQRAGLFEKQGLDVELILITGGPASISALLNADVDLDMRAPIAALQEMSQGVKFTFLLSQSNPLKYDVVTRPEIKDIKHLKGKKSELDSMSHRLQRRNRRAHVQVNVGVQQSTDRRRSAGDENQLDIEPLFFKQPGALRDVGNPRGVAGDRCVGDTQLVDRRC